MVRPIENRARRGSALVVVVFTVLALAAMSAAMISTNLFRHGATRGVHESERAHQAALSGFSLALYELQEGTDLTGDEIGAATGTVMGGDFTVTVAPPYAGTGEYTLTSSASYGPSARGMEVVVSSDRKFGFGIFADEGITLNGDFLVDSYDSSLGSYAGQVFGDHAGENGDIASNWHIQAGGHVWGDATPGPDHQVLGDTSKVSGSTSPALFPIEIRPLRYDPVGASAGTYGGTKTFTSGSYRYDALKMSTGVMTIDGDVTLYVDGDFQMTGTSKIRVKSGSSLTLHHGSGKFSMAGQGLVNDDAATSRVSILSSTHETFKFAGTSDFHGMIIAPEAELTIGGTSSVFGVFLAREAMLKGTGGLHYDDALRVPDFLSPRFQILSAYPVGD